MLERPAKIRFFELRCSWRCFFWRLVAGAAWWSRFSLTILRYGTGYLVRQPRRAACQELGSVVTDEHPRSSSESSGQYSLTAKVSLGIGCVPACLVSRGKSIQTALCLHNSLCWQSVSCVWILLAAFWEELPNHGWKCWLVLGSLPTPINFSLEKAPITDESPSFFFLQLLFANWLYGKISNCWRYFLWILHSSSSVSSNVISFGLLL